MFAIIAFKYNYDIFLAIHNLQKTRYNKAIETIVFDWGVITYNGFNIFYSIPHIFNVCYCTNCHRASPNIPKRANSLNIPTTPLMAGESVPFSSCWVRASLHSSSNPWKYTLSAPLQIKKTQRRVCLNSALSLVFSISLSFLRLCFGAFWGLFWSVFCYQCHHIVLRRTSQLYPMTGYGMHK